MNNVKHIDTNSIQWKSVGDGVEIFDSFMMSFIALSCCYFNMRIRLVS